MIYKTIRSAFCIALAFSLSSVLFAQDPRIVAAAGDKYLISAEAGGVNFTEGTVSIVRKEGKSGALLKRDQIEIGDRVTTGADGKVEILMNPGSYIRLGANSAFEFNTTSLDDLRLKLDSGSAMFEVFATNEFSVSVSVPKGVVNMVETGIYRIDVQPNGVAKIAVWNGLAKIGNGAEIKKGRTAEIDGRAATIIKFDRDEKDSLAVWSQERGKLLAKASASLKNQAARTSLINSFNGGRWGMYDAFGLWMYSAQFGGHCFIPFGRGWYSPYGYWYGNNIWWYDLPTIIYFPITVTPNIYGTKRQRRDDIGGGSGGGNTAPPFVRAEEGVKTNTRWNIPDSTTDRSAPVFYPSTPQIIVVAPSSTGAKPRNK